MRRPVPALAMHQRLAVGPADQRSGARVSGANSDTTDGPPTGPARSQDLHPLLEPRHPVRELLVGHPVPADVAVLPTVIGLDDAHPVLAQVLGDHLGVLDDRVLGHGQQVAIPRDPAAGQLLGDGRVDVRTHRIAVALQRLEGSCGSRAAAGRTRASRRAIAMAVGSGRSARSRPPPGPRQRSSCRKPGLRPRSCGPSPGCRPRRCPRTTAFIGRAMCVPPWLLST